MTGVNRHLVVAIWRYLQAKTPVLLSISVNEYLSVVLGQKQTCTSHDDYNKVLVTRNRAIVEYKDFRLDNQAASG